MAVVKITGYPVILTTAMLEVNVRAITCQTNNITATENIEFNDLLENIRILLHYIIKQRKNLMMKEPKRTKAIKRAWLIRWNFYTDDEEEQLKEFGISNKIFDIVNVRKTFDQIIDMAKDIYRQATLSLSEKIFLEHYSEGKKRKREFFQRTPVSTNYTTTLYKDYMKSFRENGMNHPVTEKLYSEWRKYPVHITIGNNPALEAILVSNLVINNNDGREVLEWDELLVDGTLKKERYGK